MLATDNDDYISEVADRALTLMREHSVPLTPQNYEIWFTYSAGMLKDLNRTIDVILSNGQDFSRKISDEIYDRFFAPSRLDGTVKVVGERVQSELGRVISSLKRCGTDTSKYNEQLAGASGSLESTTHSAESLKRLVDDLLGATKAMSERSHLLEKRLEESTKEINRLQENLEVVRAQSLTDALTGIANRKAFDERLKEAVTIAMETGEPLALLLADIDHFKQFNDKWGHQTGDQVLRLVAHVLRQNLKGRDLPARYGGEEFAVLLPCTALRNARQLADHIRVMIQGKKVIKRSSKETLGAITLSFGCAQFDPGESVGDFIERADTCLYAAKHQGRNRVITEDELSEQDQIPAKASA